MAVAISYFQKHKRDSYRHRKNGKNGYRIGVASVDYERPGMKNILGDFEWRRTHMAPVPRKVVETLVRGYLKSFGWELTGAFYSRYAGCSCPCSPGYILYGRRIPGQENWLKRTKFNFNPQWEEFSISLAPSEKIYEFKRKKVERELEKIKKAQEAVLGAGI
ncbi:MAG: hypothetical protein OEV56_03240 [Dehalococcoidia bacterium]|nr:hypothetical protein [Dehalococcoidia bacterium]